jgi:hypothetical protein
MAYQAGRIPAKAYACASLTHEGLIHASDAAS